MGKSSGAAFCQCPNPLQTWQAEPVVAVASFCPLTRRPRGLHSLDLSNSTFKQSSGRFFEHTSSFQSRRTLQAPVFILSLVAQAKRGFDESSSQGSGAGKPKKEGPASSSNVAEKGSSEPTAVKAQAPRPSRGGMGTSERLPEIVSQRMLTRVVGFSAPPFFLSLSAFPIYYALSHSLNVQFAPILPFATSSICIFISLFGITYGLLSASWDPVLPGSALGWKEFKTNVPVLMEMIKNTGEAAKNQRYDDNDY